MKHHKFLVGNTTKWDISINSNHFSHSLAITGLSGLVLHTKRLLVEIKLLLLSDIVVMTVCLSKLVSKCWRVTVWLQVLAAALYLENDNWPVQAVTATLQATGH